MMPDHRRSTVTEGKVGRAPQLDAVNKAVANAIKTPGTGADVRIDYSDVDMPIGVDAANQAAADANQRLNNKIVLTNDRDRNFELSNDTVASWIKPTGDVQNGTIILSYDEQAIKDYLAAELPKQLNQEKTDQTGHHRRQRQRAADARGRRGRRGREEHRHDGREGA